MILNHAQLQARAREFALTHELGSQRQAYKFWPAFRFDVSSLRAFADLLHRGRANCTQPAEDWLLDHIDFLEQQAQVVVEELPRRLFHQLPRLQNSGMPRIYAICDDYLEQVDGCYDVHSFTAYVNSYQEVAVLKLQECWSLKAAMRVMIIRRLANAMRAVRQRHEVCEYAARLFTRLGNQRLDDGDIRAILAYETREKPLSSVEIVHLISHLSELQPDIHIVREWLRAHVENSAQSLDQMVSYEHQLQAELQVTCGNLVQSLHRFERLPWDVTFKEISQIETILNKDPLKVYQKMDDASCDRLRQRIAQLASRLRVPESLVARTALQLAAAALGRDEGAEPDRNAFFAYYLFDPSGLRELRQSLLNVCKPRPLPHLAVKKRPLPVYLTSALVMLAAFCILLSVAIGWGMNLRPISYVAIVALLLLPLSEWVVSLLHDTVSSLAMPHPLLRYDFSDHVPADAKTIVVMPVLWSSPEDVDEVMERLEVHYLANRQENIHFAVLADFADAPTRKQTGDGTIIDMAIERVQALQHHYGTEKFFLFHRSRQYNAVEKTFMGWERKRGKLVELIEVLKGKKDTSFTTVYGETSVLRGIRYVFTVDLDTKLPIGVVSRMAGTIHHPYNRPRLNQANTRVVEGYGVIQPRIGVSYESTASSRFATLWAGEAGIDPYAFAVSDIYQDLFGEAIFTGKGIFDVDAFDKTLVSRIPDNQVLSHDLLEGGFLRTGLASDIEIIDDHPATFYAFQRRLHRWIRGDWQLSAWLRTMCKDRNGKRTKNDLCNLTRWQIIDNMRRSLLPIALFVVYVLGLCASPGRRFVLEAVVLVTIFMPFVRNVLQGIALQRSMRAIRISFAQSFIQLVTLPHQAVLAFDAIVRTLYRLLVSHRKLLEWVTSNEVSKQGTGRRIFVYESTTDIVICLAAAVVAPFVTPTVQVFAIVVALCWLAARFSVSWLNGSARQDNSEWLIGAQSDLKDLAEQVWSFYKTYVTQNDSFLPPDNVQYVHGEVIAHRTSPTNIGLYLTCILAARDLNFVDTVQMCDRIEETLRSIERMEKWNGHLYNWYDTETLDPLSPKYVSTVDSGNFAGYLMVVIQGLRDFAKHEPTFAPRLHKIAYQINEMLEKMDFTSLYDVNARLFSLGYHVDQNRRDTVLYDLLASEARQASFVAIALGQIEVSHWFTMGRTMTLAGGYKTLLSWSGTMFEYLMPSLIMKTYHKTVWESTYRGVIDRQYGYAKKRGIPFGISESGYYAFDYQLNYQYRAFGVPGLGFDTGMEKNLVVAPYATVMSLPYTKEAGMRALDEMRTLGAEGRFGFYEAIDFTRERLPEGKRYEVVQSFMAHHQGMSLLTIANLLTGDMSVKRFHGDPRVKATELILQERIPDKAALLEHPIALTAALPDMGDHSNDSERVYEGRLPLPAVNMISNGKLATVMSNDGAGFLTWNNLMVTRWHEDSVLDNSGPAIYIHDVIEEQTSSICAFPCEEDDVKSTFRLDKTTFESKHDGILAKMCVAISPDVDAEVREITLTNQSGKERVVEVTSMYELALATQSADRSHIAFSKLFVQTSHDETRACLLAKRRPREENEQETWAVHTMYTTGQEAGSYEYETDRAEFIGRGRTLVEPRAMKERLTGSTGSVADPAFVMRRRVHLEAGESAKVYIVTGVADNKDAVLEIVDRLREPEQAQRAFHLAFVRSQIDLRHMSLSMAQAVAAQTLAARMLYTPPFSKIRAEAIAVNRLGQSSLWPRGISGDVPIAVVRIQNLADLPFVTLLACQHQYLLQHGASFDLVVLEESVASYQDELVNRLNDQLASKGIVKPQRIIHLKASAMTEEEKALLFAVARVLLRANGPSLGAQLQVDERQLPRLASHGTPPGLATVSQQSIYPLGKSEREFDNGWGGFVDDGRAYQIDVKPGNPLPRPWTNVIANRKFGTIITELGTGYTWWRNSRECKLTPWSNDPVLDPPGEALFLQDLDTGALWSGGPKPAGETLEYTVTHGRGYSRFTQDKGVIAHEMETIVPLDDTVKLIRVKLLNQSGKHRRVSVSYYAEWVLGVTRTSQAPYITTSWDAKLQTLIATNRYQEVFRDAHAFLHFVVPEAHVAGAGGHDGISYTGNRMEFIGRCGDIKNPAALSQAELSNQTGAFANSCGAIQTTVELAEAGEVEFLVLVGCADSAEEVARTVRKYDSLSAYEKAFAEVEAFWRDSEAAVVVKTPDRAFDILLNGWLIYQSLACRMWARTAFYQAGGAFGFRDQLQDSLAMLHINPMLTRQQILLNAAHQYQEGDVQHWWHEETGKGIRTKFSDDLLWLPYAVSRYIEHTGDMAILNETIPFLKSDVLREDELERYESTVVSDETGTLLDHCLRAIHHGMRYGEHGIPLMGIGDWNDGMNRIGAKGRGESVWLGWFLLDILKRFLALKDILKPEDVETFEQQVVQLTRSLNEYAWDGAWFRRAFTDAGTWLGSTQDTECRIDAIAQSWSVISCGASAERAMRAMRSFDRELVDERLLLARLLTPAFDETTPSPGYIQGYPPGIRENGGQYTHGVIWGIVAWAMLNRRDKAFELFNMLSPIHHTSSKRDVLRFGCEPYVMSADVYTAAPHEGRAGWSWYTGAAGWMYQAGLEYILGVKRRGEKLFIEPCVPEDWRSYTVSYRYGQATYHIEVLCQDHHHGAATWTVDGNTVAGDWLTLVDDGLEHQVFVIAGPMELDTVG